MDGQQIIDITNGVGTKNLVNGTYTVTSSTNGYNNLSIDPSTESITEGINEYDLKIAATGTLTIHTSDDGTSTGTPIVGAKFIRCDSSGATYGTEVVTNSSGNAVFNFVPFAATEAPLVYYKQTESDGNHTFNDLLQNTSLTTETRTLELTNAPAPTRTFNLTDTNYSGLPIATGQIILE